MSFSAIYSSVPSSRSFSGVDDPSTANISSIPVLNSFIAESKYNVNGSYGMAGRLPNLFLKKCKLHISKRRPFVSFWTLYCEGTVWISIEAVSNFTNVDVFDSGGHSLLLKKLQLYGIPSTVLSWLWSYLSGGLATVSLNSSASTPFFPLFGVHESFILGLFPFSFFINDLLYPLIPAFYMLTKTFSCHWFSY